MRQIGSIDNGQLAERFVDYLKTKDISAQSDEEADRWIIWVRDENQLESAKSELADFQTNPEADIYQDAARRAAEIRSKEIKKRMEVKKNLHKVRGNWTGPLSKRAPVVFYLMVACVVVGVLGGSHTGVTWAKRLLKFTDVYDPNATSLFYNIFRGQVWRLITPIFLHAPWTGIGGILHIAFNLYWLQFMGSQIEARLGWKKFIVFVLAAAIIPNVMQAVIVGPNFVGISGVVYALFGYILIRRRDGYILSDFIIMLMLAFLVLDFTPMRFFPGVAVWAHAGGFGVGVALGYWPKLLDFVSSR